MAAPITIDWERIEPAWRKGIVSVLQLAADYTNETGKKVSHTAINKHFKNLGIPRDLKAKVRAKADAIVSASIVSGLVSTETTAKDADIINAGGLQIAHVELSERHDIKRTMKFVQKMTDELETVSDCTELLKQLGELLIDTTNDADTAQAKRLDLLNKVISLPSRIDSLKKLAETLKVLIGLEREAFGLNNEPTEKPKELSHAELDDKLSKLLRKAGYVPANAGQTLQ